MIPLTGPFSMLGEVLTELRSVNPGRNPPVSLQDADVRALAGVTGPSCSTADLRGKSAYVAMQGSIADVSETDDANPPTSRINNIPISISFTGGKAPFNFAWTKVSGGGSVTPANAASTTAKLSNPRFSEPGDGDSCVVQCVITDATNAQLVRQGTATLYIV